MKSKLRNAMIFLIGISIFIIVGIVLLAYHLVSIISFDAAMVKISRVDSDIIYVTYNYQDTLYENIPFDTNIHSDIPLMKAGDEIKIYINPENPTEYKYLRADLSFPIGCLVLSVPFVYFGVRDLKSYKKRKKEVDKLRKDGIKKYLKIIDITQDTSTSFNGHHPSFIVCENPDATSDDLKELKSENSSFTFTYSLIGQFIAAYFSEKDEFHPFVDEKDIVSEL